MAKQIHHFPDDPVRARLDKLENKLTLMAAMLHSLLRPDQKAVFESQLQQIEKAYEFDEEHNH